MGRRKLILDDEPNYNKEAYQQGYNAFLGKKSIMSNPFNIISEESSYGDWRIGWQQSKMDKKIKRKRYEK